MRELVYRWGAAIVGVAITCQVTTVYAGTVAPPIPDPLAMTAATTARNTSDVASASGDIASPSGRDSWAAPAFDAPALTAVPITSSPKVDSSEATEHPLIPLPAAAWTGMACLLGLGAIKLLRNARRLLA